MTTLDQAALQGVLHAIRSGTLRDEWAAWLIFADWLDETPDAPVRGEGLYGQPDRDITRGLLAAKVRAAIAAEQALTAANGGRRDRSDLAIGYQDDSDLTTVLTGGPVRWYI